MHSPAKSGGIAAAALFAGGSLLAGAGLAISSAARADNLTISTALTAPVATATAANNSPGNISVTSTGSVSVASGTAATINSNNTLTNGGTLSTNAASGGVGILIDGTRTGFATLVNNGTVTASTTGGTGNIGLLVTGGPISGSISSVLTGSIAVAGTNSIGASLAAPFTGNIQLRTVSAAGDNSTAVAVTAPVIGNLSLVGTMSQRGTGGYGLLVAAPVSGTISNGASISVGTTRALDTAGGIAPGLISTAGVRIKANIGGGFVNDRYYVNAAGAIVPPAQVDLTKDTLVTGAISSTGTAPALWVAPDAANPQNIALGAVGTGSDAYAIVNRGSITTTLGNYGLATTALRVGGGGATTTLAGGIISQAGASITSTSFDAATTAVDIMAGAVVPAFQNLGTISASSGLTAATGTVVESAGGAAYGVVVEQGASMPSLVNSGTIQVGSVGANNNSAAIVDKSGTLTTITNSGTLYAEATGTGGIARTIDLTASASAVSVTNSGTITGAIAFGSGYSTLNLTAGTISGAIAFGSGGGLLAMSGTSTLSNVLTSGRPLDVTLAGTAKLDLTKGPLTIGSIAASGASVLVLPVGAVASPLTVTGAASFTGTSTISLALLSLDPVQDVIVINAAGGITTDHLSTLIGVSSTPYLFTASAPVLTDTTLSVSLVRKTAAQIGLINGQAALYDQSIVALEGHPTESSAIANLPDQASVVAAYRQITPPSFGRAQLRTAQTVADAGFGATADRLTVIDNMHHGRTKGIGVWVQEFGNLDEQDAGVNELGYSSSSFGFAGGVDFPVLGMVAGLALITNWSNVSQNSAPGLDDVPVNISTQGLQPYLYWSYKAFFAAGMGLIAHTSYNSTRSIVIGTFADTISADWTGRQYAASAIIGARFDLGKFRIVPSNAISWTQLRQNEYTEVGGGAFALAVDAQQDTVTANTARLSVAYAQPFQQGNLRFELHGAYAYQFNASPTDTIARYVSGGAAMSLPGDTIVAGQTGFGANISYVQGSAIISLGYDRRQDSDYHNQALVVSAGMTF